MRYAYHFGRRGFFDSERIRCMNEIGFDWTIQGVEALGGKFSDNIKDGDESPQDPGDADALSQSDGLSYWVHKLINRLEFNV